MDLIADLISFSGGIVFGVASLGFGIAILVGGGSAWLGITLATVGVVTLAASVVRSAEAAGALGPSGVMNERATAHASPARGTPACCAPTAAPRC